MKKTDSILLTGGSGFIGSVVLKQLNDAGYEKITIVDKFDGPRGNLKWKNLIGKTFNLLIDYEEFDFALAKSFDIVIHLGALNDTSNPNFSEFIKQNYRFSLLLLSSLKEDATFIYASSASTYGNGNNFDDDITKLDDLKPTNAYGMSKHLFDQLFINLPSRKGKTIGLKFFNVFGPNEYHKQHYSSYFYRVLQNIEQNLGNKIIINLFEAEDKEIIPSHAFLKRDFIYVEDVAYIITEILKNPVSDNIYNVGSGNPLQWENAIDILMESFDKKNDNNYVRIKEYKINHISIPDSIKEGYQYYTKANIDKLKKDYPNLDYERISNSAKNGLKKYAEIYFKKRYI